MPGRARVFSREFKEAAVRRILAGERVQILAKEPLGYQCRLDGGVPEACTSPATYLGLSEGPHAFEVWVIDLANNTGAAAIATWTVDMMAPVVTLTERPAASTTSTSATFGFVATDAVTAPATLMYECRLDGGAFTGCASPATYTVSEGAHTVDVRATDEAGNTSAAVSAAWTVDGTPPPAPVILSGPANPTNATTATFVVGAAEAGVAFLCQLDGGAFSACASPQSYGALGEGGHAFAAKARDAAGNQSTATSYAWVVDLTAPDTSVTSGPEGEVGVTSATVTFTGMLPGCRSPSRGRTARTTRR